MVETHPLNAADEERSKARVADIELGLSHPVDGDYWRSKLEQRIQMLADDRAIYGLVPHEEVELEQLQALKAKAQAREQESRQDAGDRRRGLSAFSPPPPSRKLGNG